MSISTSYSTTRREHQTYESPSCSSLRRGRSPRPTVRNHLPDGNAACEIYPI